MQYPICSKVARYELVAVAGRYPKDATGWYLAWKLNDGHTAKTIDLIQPTIVGQLLVQPYGEDRKRFIVNPKEAAEYNFGTADATLPYPEFVFAKRHMYAGQDNQVVILNDDTSADLTLTCDNTNVVITKLSRGHFKVVPSLDVADSVITLSAVANYNNRVFNPIHKDIYVAQVRPKAPKIVIANRGKVNEELQFTIDDVQAGCIAKVYTEDGKIIKVDDTTFKYLSSKQGIAKIVACTMTDTGLTSELVEAQVSIFTA